MDCGGHVEQGNWIPIDKRVVDLLPKGERPFTYLEALISLSINLDNKQDLSIRLYASRWGWSRNKVRKFIEELRTNGGTVVGQKGTSKGHVIRLVNNNLSKVEGQSRASEGPLEDHSGTTFIYPNTNPDTNPKEKGKNGRRSRSFDDIPYDEIVDYMNEKIGSSYKSTTKKTRDLIRGRWGEGFRAVDFQRVVDNMVAEWLHDNQMSAYLRPETLFGTKFEGYLNRKVKIGGNGRRLEQWEIDLENLCQTG